MRLFEALGKYEYVRLPNWKNDRNHQHCYIFGGYIRDKNGAILSLTIKELQSEEWEPCAKTASFTDAINKWYRIRRIWWAENEYVPSAVYNAFGMEFVRYLKKNDINAADWIEGCNIEIQEE